MAQNPWIEIEETLKNEVTDYELSTNEVQMSDEKSVIHQLNSSYQSNYSFCNEQVPQVVASKHEPRDFSKRKINTQTCIENSINSNALQLDRFNVLNEYQARLPDEILEENHNVGSADQPQFVVGPVCSTNINYETSSEEELIEMPIEPKLWKYPNITKMTNPSNKLDNIENKQPNSIEDEFRLTTLQQEQRSYSNQPILPPAWEAGCSLTTSDVHTFEKIKPHNLMINPNRATYLGSDGWRSMPNEINQPSNNIVEFQLVRLQQEQHPHPSYSNLPLVLDSVSHSSNPYFYSVLDEELKALPGGPKRWRYLIRDLIRADSNIMRPDRWRFLLNDIKKSHTNIIRTRNTPKYVENYGNKLIPLEPTQLINSQEKPPKYPGNEIE